MAEQVIGDPRLLAIIFQTLDIDDNGMVTPGTIRQDILMYISRLLVSIHSFFPCIKNYECWSDRAKLFSTYKHLIHFQPFFSRAIFWL